MSGTQEEGDRPVYERQISNMPAAATVRNELVMRIEHVQWVDDKKNDTACHFDFVCANGERHQVWGRVYEFDDDRFRGYLPSKLWKTGNNYQMVFYCSNQLPTAARAFGDGKTYVLLFDIVNSNERMTIEYDADMRIFIDQLINDQTNIITYVVLFGDALYDRVIDCNQSQEYKKDGIL